jgi:hypothetical protein
MKRLLYLLTISLASCAAPGGGAHRSLPSPTPKPGPVVLTGYLGYRGELLLYETREDYREGRYRHCISGLARDRNPDYGRLIYDGKLVKITGEMFKYELDPDPLAAMLDPLKNDCRSPLFFIADSIEVAE